MIAFIKRLWRDRRGNALIIAGATLPLLVGSAGLAVDTVQWAMWKRQLQRAADSAAFAGVYAKVENHAEMTAERAVASDLDKHNTTGVGLLTGYPQITYPTSSDYTKGVQVTIAISKALGFSSLFMSQAPTIRATGAAALFDDGNYCVVALAPTGRALTIGGSANVSMGCGAISNSNDPTESVRTDGNSYSFVADPIAAVGGMPSSINGATELQPYHIAMDDPYSSLSTSVPSGMNCKNFSHPSTTNPDGSKKTGCYNDLKLSGATSVLSPGVYYVNGDIKLTGNARLEGTGVTIILTGTIDMSGGSSIDLTAPTTGPYAKMLLIQSPNALTGNDNTINGSNDSTLDGAIYFPKGDLKFTGSSAASTQCAMIVAYTVDFSGSANIQNDTSNCEAATQVVGKKVRLIG